MVAHDMGSQAEYCVGRDPCVNPMLQATAGAIIRDCLAIGEVDTVILDHGATGVDVIHRSRAATNRVT